MINPSDVKRGRILIVDDQQADVALLERMLQSAGYAAVSSTSDPTEVVRLHEANRFDLILLDLMMPTMSGFEVMEGLKRLEQGSYLPVLAVTADPAQKVAALTAGAKDFVSKPFDFAEVLLRVFNMLEVRLLHGDLRALAKTLQDTMAAADAALVAHERAMVRAASGVGGKDDIVTQSASMRALVDMVRRVAKVDSTVLVTGESGSGKERVARMVHTGSARASGPFVAINCGAITETLLESELFGHARGAFTGAAQDRAGLFEAANGGTLLLDEVGEVSPGMQVKLLRVLQEREVRRVGENKSRKVDVRVVAATNRDLGEAVARGTFRQDLYYRLKVLELRVPPLRERKEDVLALAHELLANAATRMERSISGLAPAAADLLVRYGWPGNVRELENAIERGVAMARGTRVDVDDLPEEVREGRKELTPLGSPKTLEAFEKECILATLALNGGNQARTATQLKIGSATLYRKLKSYGMTEARAPAAPAAPAAGPGPAPPKLAL